MKPIRAISAALLFAVLGAAVPAPAQVGWVDNAMKAKRALDTAQKAKEIADAAAKAKQIADVAEKAKQAADMVNKAKQVQQLGNRAKQIQDLGKQIEPQPLLRSNLVRGVPRPIRPEPRPLHDVLLHSKDWTHEHQNWVQRGGYRGYHIPNDWFNARYGAAHPFRLNLFVSGNHPCFDFGGYSFELVDPVPPGYADNWNQTDDVTVNEDNSAGGYYLEDTKYPDGQYPSFLMSLTASDLPCARLSAGFTVANDGTIREDFQPDDQLQAQQNQPQQEQPQQEQAQEAQPQENAAKPQTAAPPDLSQTNWSGQVVFETGGGFLVGKFTRTLGHGGSVTLSFLPGGEFIWQGERGKNKGSWALSEKTVTFHVPAHGCNGQGASFTGFLSPAGDVVQGTWFEASGAFLPCGKGSGTFELHRNGGTAQLQQEPLQRK